MKRSRTVLTAAAFALLIGSAATAQPQMQMRPPDAAIPTPEQIAATPAAKRLEELVAAINSGDDQAMRELVEGFAPTPEEAKMAMGMPPLARVRDIYRRTRGLTIIGFNYAKDEFATATVRNHLTQGLEVLTVRAETKPPHRIISIPRVPAEPLPDPNAATATPPTDDAARLKEIESYVQRLADADVFSGVVLIARAGKPIFSKAYGLANREKSVPNTIDTPFLLGSMNKLFTSLAIGQLVEQGKLSYDDPLSKFLPDFPDPESAKKIRIRHLLTHTSGLGSYFNPRFFEKIDSLRDVKSVLNVAGREAPAFEPGTSWRYSNTGFLLLGRIIEIVTGKDYYESMAANVFGPAGMTSTGFPHYDRGERKVALPYEVQPNEKDQRLGYVDQSAETPRRGGPAGGGVSTAPDLLRLANALQAGKIVKPATYALHAAAKPELSSPTYGYGFVRSARTKGRDTSGHGGNAPGQCTEFNTIHDLPVPYTVVVLANSSGNACIPVYQKIVNTFAPAPAAKAAKASH